MTRLDVGEGVQLHWEEQGSGPLVVLSPHWSGVPEVFDPLIEDLSRDHRVVRYDARGTGLSTRKGPHDMETGASDLTKVLEAAGKPAVLIGIADAANRVVRVGARQPDLVLGAISLGTAPLRREHLRRTDAMAGSDSVADAFLQMIETGFESALWALMPPANPQLNQQELRERIAHQVEYAPKEVAAERLRAWLNDDPFPEATDIGGRLHLALSPVVAGPWMPSLEEFIPLQKRLLPEARIEAIEDGIMSRPDLTAALVRRITA